MSKVHLIEFKSGETLSGDLSGAIGIVEALAPQEVIKVLRASQLAHLVQKTGIAYDAELKLANAMSGNLREFMDEPLQLILGSSEAAYPSLHINSTAADKKGKTLDQFEEFLKSLRGARRIRDSALMIADELYTNAAKNSGKNGKLRLASEESGAEIREGTVEFFASCDDSRLVFGCRDSFGELGFGTVLNRINECFENGITESIKNGDGGAGIGSFMVFRACIGYYCGVEKGKRTVVCVALPLGASSEDTETLPKNVHLRAA